MNIRFKNTRTGRAVAAKDGADLAAMVKIEQDRRSGLEVATFPPDSEELKTGAIGNVAGHSPAEAVAS